MLLAVSLIHTCFETQYYYYVTLVAMNIRTALIAAVYRKALCISHGSRRESTIGEIVNLMSVDSQHVVDFVMYFSVFWFAPLTFLFGVFLLWRLLGQAIFYGLFVFAIVVPINTIIVFIVEKLQIKQMHYKDERIRLITEFLGGIKILKMYSWEVTFEERIHDIRKKENSVLQYIAIFNGIFTMLWYGTPIAIAIVSFAAFVWSDDSHVLTADIAFSSMAILNLVKHPLSIIPTAVSALIQAKVSSKRLSKFLHSEETNPDSIDKVEMKENAIEMDDASFSFTSDQEPFLNHLSMKIKKGSLVAIVGKVGSGRSSILGAMLGEMVRVSGTAAIDGSIAYVPQQAWIRSGVLKENITIAQDEEMTIETYNEIIEACALTQDFKKFPEADLSEVGEKGLNLSGGQKQRVNLARAVCANADIYLLDDPLSAIDPIVSKHIFKHVISKQGLLQYATRIIATHNLSLLTEVDYIYVLKDGRLIESGNYKNLISLDTGSFISVLKETTNLQGQDSKISLRGSASGAKSKEPYRPILTHHRVRNKEMSMHNISLEPYKFIHLEEAASGKVKAAVYFYYIKALCYWKLFLILLFHVFTQVVGVTQNWQLTYWTQDEAAATDQEVRDYYLMIYAILGCIQGVMGGIVDITLLTSSATAAHLLHQWLLARITLAPAHFFDSNPTGRIISRFSKDVDVIDNNLPIQMSDMAWCIFELASVMSVIMWETPWFVTCLIPIITFYWLLQALYVRTSRQIRRLESISRSPVYSHFAETLNGLSVIHAYGLEKMFMLESEARVDESQIGTFYVNVSTRWLSLRAEYIGHLITFFASLFVILAADSSPEKMGMSLTYALQVTGALDWGIQMFAEVKTNLVAVERIKEYSECEQEGPLINPDHRPPENWPDKGEIKFDHYSAGYREDSTTILSNLTFIIHGSEKIGVVGRTGAGKSSLTLALFRIFEARSGCIVIDGEDISKMGLHDLRSKLSIIPQEPLMFRGTLRFNIDPMNSHLDEELWAVLEHVNLRHFVQNTSLGLDYLILEEGENLSVGQKQLVCLARALLCKTRIVVMDEATASVDLQTDKLMQRTIHSAFQQCTILTIAHRILSIMESDRILVLDAGEEKEYDTPTVLLNDKTSIFSTLVRGNSGKGSTVSIEEEITRK